MAFPVQLEPLGAVGWTRFTLPDILTITLLGFIMKHLAQPTTVDCRCGQPTSRVCILGYEGHDDGFIRHSPATEKHLQVDAGIYL